MDFHGFKDTDLIPELKEWKKINGENFDIESWIAWQSSPETLIGYSSIFYPEFERFGNAVFFKDTLPSLAKFLNTTTEKILKENQGEKLLSFQSLQNHRHIWDLVATENNQDQISCIQLKFIATILKDIWGLKLNRDFPDLEIHIEIFGLEDEEDLVEITLTFWTELKKEKSK